ncbi:hypothetical protein ONZ51_g11086 [Trametes cubensis]|uniref:HMG box domain-containing protein n=1 Tax=Trametes cubensis TaxID=1111947 RepID=A0AAD7TI82_9APHY|nr:hypothetical protein ONZ51_g11086 [Trametes cubensis]
MEPSPNDRPRSYVQATSSLANLKFKKRTDIEKRSDASSSSTASSTPAVCSDVSDVVLQPRIVPSVGLPRVSAVSLPETERRPSDTPNELPTPPSSIPRLVVNRRGIPPSVCSAFDGKVACRGIFTTIIITSPNMDYIPQYPVERQVVPTYSDGRWGLHEYSRCPQVLLSDVWHVACIPRCPSPPELPTVLWENLSVHTHWRIDPRTGVAGLGFILPDVQEDLLEAVRMTRLRLTEVVEGPPESLEYGKYLLMVLSQAVERMEKMPSSAQSAVVVAAHIQRLCLEAEGLRTYMRVVYPRLIGSADYRHDVLPVLGAFVQEGTTAQACTKAGLPVWLLQPLTPSVNIWKVVDPEPLPFGLSEEQCSPPLMHDTSVMSGVVNLTNNWVRDASLRVSKLVAGSRLPTLAPSEVQSILATRDDVHPVKRPKAVDSRREYTHLGMKPLSRSLEETDKERGRKGPKPRGDKEGQVTQAPGGAAGQPMAGQSSPKLAAPAEPPQPARFFMQSPFYSIPAHWMRALQSASPVPRSAAQALYFYPPPFLLDTVCPEAPAHEPGPGTRVPPEQKTRGRRRLEERNGIGRLFGQVALLPPYAADMVPRLGDLERSPQQQIRHPTLLPSFPFAPRFPAPVWSPAPEHSPVQAADCNMGGQRSFDKPQWEWLIEQSRKAESAKFISGETKDHAGLADKLLPDFRVAFPNWSVDGNKDDKSLRERLRRWSVSRHTTREQRQASADLAKDLLPGIASPRAKREIIGLDEFQKSDAAPERPFMVDAGKRRVDIGAYRTACKQIWDKLSEEEKDKYVERAQARNKQRSEDAMDGDESPTLYNRTAIADGCEHFMRSLKAKTGCASFLCVAGPDRDGKPFVWMRSEGEDREGIKLLDFVLKGTGIEADEVYALSNVWIHRSRQDGPVHDGDLSAQLRAALRDARVATMGVPSGAAASTRAQEAASTTQHSTDTDAPPALAEATTRLPAATGIFDFGTVDDSLDSAEARGAATSPSIPVTVAVDESIEEPVPQVLESSQSAETPHAVAHVERGSEENNHEPGSGQGTAHHHTKGKKRKSQGGRAPRQLKRPKGTSGVEMPANEPTTLAAGRPGREGRRSARQRGLDPLMTLAERAAMEAGPQDVEHLGGHEEAIQRAGKGGKRGRKG